ncbi:MAG TPA: hypothetical protein VFV43_05010, partial [Limnobacter sp.]|nr:hypothetical protein [Limnobacter sp.]
GVIALRSGAQVLGINTANFASQCATAPSTFRNDLQTANSSNTSIRDDNTAPTAPNPDDALERFYRNELGGSWILDRFEPTSGAVQRAGLDTSISLLSFDRGCTSDCTTVNDGRTLINRFVGGDYDSEESANVSADARIGRVVYVRNDSPITNDPNLGKFLIRNPNDNRQLRSNASGAAAGSTDAGEDIYNRPLVLNGDELVVQFEDGNLVYKRFANVKNSLVGTWVEDLSGENANATGAPNPTNGRHSFLREGRSIVYHFLNSSRLMLIVTDLETTNTGDEQNGVLYADYTFANGAFTITNVLANTTATTAGGGILVAGDSLPLSASSLNDTKRTLDATGQEPIDIYRLLSLTESTDESSAGFKQANAQEAVAAR